MNHLQTISKILVVDDHPMMRDGLTMRISSQADLEVCGQAATEDEAFAFVKKSCPCLVIVDISLKSGDGIELTKRVKAYDPTIKILVLSAFQESLYAERALRAGALGYLNKQESSEKLIEAVRTVLKGERFLSEQLTKRLIAHALGMRDDKQNPVELLSDRELEIFRLIGRGLTTGAIANQLRLSTHTIDTHRENIKRKLCVNSGAEMNRLAIQLTLEGC